MGETWGHGDNAGILCSPASPRRPVAAVVNLGSGSGALRQGHLQCRRLPWRRTVSLMPDLAGLAG